MSTLKMSASTARKVTVVRSGHRRISSSGRPDPTVTTYRLLKPQLVHDESTGTPHMRFPGDFVPEAAHWKNLGTYLRSSTIEICYVNRSVLDTWLENYEERIAEEDERKAEEAAIEAQIAASPEPEIQDAVPGETKAAVIEQPIAFPSRKRNVVVTRKATA
jgi:hypothetical protein